VLNLPCTDVSTYLDGLKARAHARLQSIDTETMMLALPRGAYSDACRQPCTSHGLMRVRPQPAKSSVSRVTMAARATKAVAAINASNVWIGAPA
jgi:hypothetical protein